MHVEFYVSLPNVRNFTQFLSTFKHLVHHENFEIISMFNGCMSAYTDNLCPRSSALGSGGRRFEEGSHLCFTYFKKKKKEKNLCGMKAIE